MRSEQQQKVNEFQARIKEISSMLQNKVLVLEPCQSFQEEPFGLLKSNELITVTLDNKIKICNLVYTECVATLEGHTKDFER